MNDRGKPEEHSNNDTARTRGYGISQKVRKRIEQGLDWIKIVGGLRKLPMVGIAAVHEWVIWHFFQIKSTPSC